MFSSSFLGGLSLSGWARLLRANGGRIRPRHLPAAALITADAALTSVLRRFEPEARLGPAAERLWAEPVFLLGLPRSGTTYLQSLFALNPEFAFPTRLDCFHPQTFRTLHRLGLASLMGRRAAWKRSLDNVRMGWLSPEEDEFALTALTEDGPWLGVTFGDRLAHYRRRCPLDPGWDGGERWCQALATFTRQLVAHSGKRLVLKSPLHLMRIPDILSVFPAARFVMLFRDPVSHLQSTLSGAEVYRRHPWPALQRFESPDDDYLDGTAELLASYDTSRARIAPDRLVELTYESLVADPAAELGRIHQRLDLPGFEGLRRRLDARDVAARYQPNRHRELTPEQRRRVLSVYAPLFRAGHYAGTYRRLEEAG